MVIPVDRACSSIIQLIDPADASRSPCFFCEIDVILDVASGIELRSSKSVRDKLMTFFGSLGAISNCI